MVGIGTEDGVVECWDFRCHSRAGKLDVTGLSSAAVASGNVFDSISGGAKGCTALQFDTDGLTMGVGTADGYVHLYDLRRADKLLSKDHLYGEPVENIHFHNTSGNIISADRKAVRIWDRNDGTTLGTLEPDGAINGLEVWPDSGLIFVPCDTHRIGTYLIPSLGPAPRWCSFLDTLTEELEEEKAPTVYEDYKFVAPEELETLGLARYKGTSLLKAYMHGKSLSIYPSI
jgi:ribosome biogenesis protein ENP2